MCSKSASDGSVERFACLCVPVGLDSDFRLNESNCLDLRLEPLENPWDSISSKFSRFIRTETFSSVRWRPSSSDTFRKHSRYSYPEFQ